MQKLMLSCKKGALAVAKGLGGELPIPTTHQPPLPIIPCSPEAHVLLSLYLSVLQDRLNEVSYQAQLAGLSFSAQAEWGLGFNLVFQGYSDKLDVLIDKVGRERSTAARGYCNSGYIYQYIYIYQWVYL